MSVQLALVSFLTLLLNLLIVQLHGQYLGPRVTGGVGNLLGPLLMCRQHRRETAVFPQENALNSSFAHLMQAGMDFIQLGRGLLSDRDLPKKAQAEHQYQSRCIHCNECIATIEHANGIHCTRFNPQPITMS